ncbi:Tn3 family transposase [Actinomadura parmotrematis]|uniref:Tn3 family transposase n=1 Tax=Actinomadura parmotrematis TaxID=2864039 RepID=A0ABS7FQH1_9ACTN|nr:Tn3 family transposase [Actinomadura parmotrematis]MBW8482611.1 Tn3 family transposase [Actinomadura parmotrematis]
MPVEFLSDGEAAAYGRFAGVPPRAELERFFFLDDADRALVAGRRGPHNRLGWALQVTTARFVGRFLPDPLEVPEEVVVYLAEQLGIEDVSQVKRYAERRATPFEHQEEIRKAYGLREFGAVEAEFTAWVDARAWSTGDGKKTIFHDGVVWLRERKVLLPGVTTLARLVARVRDDATERLYDALFYVMTPRQRAVMELLLEVPDDRRVSDLERWRQGPSVPSGRSMERALDRAAEILSVGAGGLTIPPEVPYRRLVDLARYGMQATATLLRRHGPSRQLATLLATVIYLEGKAVDDCLDLLDVLMTTELIGKAETATSRERARQHPKLAKHSATLATAIDTLLETLEYGEDLRLDQLMESIDAIVPRRQLREAADAVLEMVPPPGADPDGEVRAQLAAKISTVSGFLKTLTTVIEFGATTEADRVLAAMKELPRLLDGRKKKVLQTDVDAALVTGSWQRLVFKTMPNGSTVDKNAYAMCVLTQFHKHLRRRDIYSQVSARWKDPRGQLLDGHKWEAAKGPALTDLSLPEDPGQLLAEHALVLHQALRDVGSRLCEEGVGVSVDEDGRLHVAALAALPEPPSLVDLRKRVSDMLPRVDLPELLLETMERYPRFTEAFSSADGGESKLADFTTSVAACLTSQALNIGYAPVVKPGPPALERARLSHIAQNYLSAETYTLANGPLIDAQGQIGFASALGGGLVAAIDGMRFVVPVPSIYTRPNKKYFGRRRGVTWLNMINDQGAGLGAKVVTGTVRDSLHMIDVAFRRDGGARPEVLVTDTGSYSDIVFGLVHLLGMQYRPALADIPDQKGWRIQNTDYGPLNRFARGKVDLDKIVRHWPDILRVVVSIYTGEVRAHDVLRMIQRDGNPTRLGDAIAHYGRIFKTLHILTYAVEEPYRRDIKGVRNLQEGRHALASRIFHGKKGELYQRYHKGMEDQLGALGLVLNCVTLWNTFYIDAALDQLKAQGYPVQDADVARLSPFVRKHINVTGTYSFTRPDLGPTGVRPLRDPDQPDGNEDHS